MFDRLLGRAELEERIEELEEEKRHLERQLDAEQERRADAQHARQEAEERINRLEDRIADLEGRLEHAEGGEARLERRREEPLRGERLAAVLDRLSSLDAADEGALTACVRGRSGVPDALGDLLGSRTALLPDGPVLVYADGAGLVATALVPPLPPEPFTARGDRFRVDRSWFLPDGRRHAVALVRSDLFALGVYEGRERVAFEGFDSDVMGDHSKGGFSQARFERRRDEQIDDHLDRVRAALADAPEPLYLVGERTVLSELDVEAAARRAVAATGQPENALADAVESFWTTRLYGL
jgi:hypothetical protein